MNFSMRSNARSFLRELGEADQDRIKAAKTAVKVELYRLGDLLREDIKTGKYAAPDLSAIAWWMKRRKFGVAPLARLYAFVGYQVDMKKGGVDAELGFVGVRASAHWRRVIQRQQEGFTTNVSESVRRWLKGRGIYLRGQRGHGKRAEAKYFFLRRTTTTTTTPGRNIIEPFWADNYSEAWRNIRSNYLRKYAGERI